MKGIIVEKGHDYSVLLLSDGTFKNIKKCRSHRVGDVIYTEDVIKEELFHLKKFTAMIAAVFVAVFLGTGVYIWATPVQYINIDINPSVELTINRLDRIIKVKSLNDDGQKLINSISINTHHYETGISEVICAAKNLGYLQDEGDILISISSSDLKRGEKTQETIKGKVDEKIEILTFDTEAHKLSVEEGLSPGKSDIIDKVIKTGTELSKEELAAVSVKDLMMKIKESKAFAESGEEASIENTKIDFNVMSNKNSNLEEQHTDVDDRTKTDNSEEDTETEKTVNGQSKNKNKGNGPNDKNKKNKLNSSNGNRDKNHGNINYKNAGKNNQQKKSESNETGSRKDSADNRNSKGNKDSNGNDNVNKKSNNGEKNQEKENKANQDKNRSDDNKDDSGIKAHKKNNSKEMHDRKKHKSENEETKNNINKKTTIKNGNSSSLNKDKKDNSGKVIQRDKKK
ncbi:MAG: hypothetical protein GX213_11850 [Clostridiaceae bacterium]|nr:hypothetical protein [Clostridiaceae bacterium]